MKLMNKINLVSLGLLFLLPSASFSQSEIIIFVGGAMTRPMSEVSTSFDSVSANTSIIVSDTTGDLTRRLASGEPADLIIVTTSAMDRLEEQQLVIGSSRVDLAVALIGMGMHPNGDMPNLSSAEAFKNTILEADSLAYVSPAAGGTSGTYIEGLLQSMGITKDIQSKIVYQTQGSEVAQAVANGDAEYGITFVSELLPNPGVKVAGTLPSEIQLPTIYTVAITSNALNTEVAQSLLNMLAGSEGRRAIMNIGLEPITP